MIILRAQVLAWVAVSAAAWSSAWVTTPVTRSSRTRTPTTLFEQKGPFLDSSWENLPGRNGNIGNNNNVNGNYNRPNNDYFNRPNSNGYGNGNEYGSYGNEYGSYNGGSGDQLQPQPQQEPEQGPGQLVLSRDQKQEPPQYQQPQQQLDTTDFNANNYVNDVWEHQRSDQYYYDPERDDYYPENNYPQEGGRYYNDFEGDARYSNNGYDDYRRGPPPPRRNQNGYSSDSYNQQFYEEQRGQPLQRRYSDRLNAWTGQRRMRRFRSPFMTSSFSSLDRMMDSFMAETNSIMRDAMRMFDRFDYGDNQGNMNGFAQSILMDAIVVLNNDRQVTDMLGSHIRMVGDPRRPLQQSMSSTNVNGRQESRVDMTFQVAGSQQQQQQRPAMVELSANTQDGIVRMTLEDDQGYRVQVPIPSDIMGERNRNNQIPTSGNENDTDVLDAEIVPETENVVGSPQHYLPDRSNVTEERMLQPSN